MQRTFNPWVAGSSPAGLTTEALDYQGLLAFLGMAGIAARAFVYGSGSELAPAIPWRGLENVLPHGIARVSRLERRYFCNGSRLKSCPQFAGKALSLGTDSKSAAFRLEAFNQAQAALTVVCQPFDIRGKTAKITTSGHLLTPARHGVGYVRVVSAAQARIAQLVRARP